jgi:hypothetical protein
MSTTRCGLLFVALLIAGCGRPAAPPPAGVGTTASVGLPESEPPVLSAALADRLKPGMAQGEVLQTLADAAKDTPSARSTLDAVVKQGGLNNVRYELTVTQGKRTLVLRFRDNKLVEMKQVGLR